MARPRHALCCGERDRDGVNPAGQQAVNPPQDRILFVHRAGHGQSYRRQHRGQRRITAEANHRRWIDLTDQTPRLNGAKGDARQGLHLAQYTAPGRRGRRNTVDGLTGEATTEVIAPSIRYDIHGAATPVQFCRQGLCRENMAAGSARR